MSELSVEDVAVHYGDTLALDGFSLNVASGEIMAVVGPSGSGKSTLLRAVAGLEPLQRGRITVAGADLSGVPTHRRGLGLMFQDHGLFSHLSVSENIAYGLRIAGLSKTVQKERVSELLTLVDLEGFQSRRTGELSGGEAQRVALARALAPEPALLMLDEPLGSLDRALRDQLTGELRRLLTDLGQTALHVTHDQAEAFALADRVAVVAAGKPVAVGSPSELWADPGTRFVAEFLGHTNIWTVAVDGVGAVTWAGHQLGVLPADHSIRALGTGRHLAVLPSTGLTVDQQASYRGSGQMGPGGSDAGDLDAGKLIVTVDESVFRRGVHDVSATVLADGPSGSATKAETSLAFTTTLPVRPGETMVVSIEVSSLRPLAGR